MSPSGDDAEDTGVGRGRLSAAFISRLRPAHGKSFSKVADLEELLLQLVQDGKAAWPDLELSDEQFMGHVAERLAPDPDPRKSLAQIQGKDLYLTCACARGDPKAIKAFDKRFAPRIAEAAARLDRSTAFVDDAKQAVLQKLFMSEGTAPPKIA